MNKPRKLFALALLTTTALALTACGGNETSSTSSNNTSHPEFSWAKVAVSNNYSPSGDITNLTPTFSWKAISGATVYDFGHEFTKGGEWKEYTVPAAEAGCATGSTICNYKPANHIFNVGEQRVWWVRGKINNQWRSWSSPYVFNVVDGSGGANTSAPIPTSPINGKVFGDNSPWFDFKPVKNAKNIVLGLEKQNGSSWESFTVNAKGNCPAPVDCPITSFRPSADFSNGNYTWWIRAELKNGSWTNWSNGADFTINASGTGGGTVLKALTPTGSINTINPTFTWTKQNNATDYQIGFDAGADWKELSVSASLINCTTNCSYTPINTGLATGDSTTWYVRAKVNGTWSEWTNGTNFSIEGTPNTGERPFIIKIQTTHVAPNIRPSQFVISTKGTGYNYNVDCNSDGVLETIGATSDYTCSYATQGEYRISITGDYPQLLFKYGASNLGPPKEKLLDIEQWGTQKWQSLDRMIQNRYGFSITATDIPDLSQAASLISPFQYVRSIPNLSEWDVSNITNMNGVFYKNYISQDISNWDVSNVKGFNLFGDKNHPDLHSRATNGLSVENYDKLLIKWSNLNLQTTNLSGNPIIFYMGTSQYSPAGAAARQKIIDNFGWTIKDAGLQ
jgi:hypothetical protein